MKEELFKDIIEGDNVTKLKNEVCDALKKMDNEEFLHLFMVLCSLGEFDDECCCGGHCDCDDCDCDDCDDCDDCHCDDCDCK